MRLLERIETIKISRKGPKIYTFFFPDNLTLFATANVENCNTINRIFQHFHAVSGQKVTISKSRLLFSMNYPINTRNLCVKTLGIDELNSFGKYLGFPMFHQKPTNRDFQFIIDNMRKKISRLEK